MSRDDSGLPLEPGAGPQEALDTYGDRRHTGCGQHEGEEGKDSTESADETTRRSGGSYMEYNM
jgi:hypothetical protein